MLEIPDFNQNKKNTEDRYLGFKKLLKGGGGGEGELVVLML